MAVVAFKDTISIFYYEIHINTSKTRVYIDTSTVYFSNGILYSYKYSLTI